MEQNTKALPQLGFSEAIKKNFSSLTDFKGRSRRSELWWNYLLYAIIAFASSMFLGAHPITQGVFSVIIQAVVLSAVTVRRLHDRGQSGLWVAAALILGIAGQIYFINSGLYELASSMNPKPEKIIEIFTSPIALSISVLSIITNITILVFSLMDSKPEENKYGFSPKYITEE